MAVGTIGWGRSDVEISSLYVTPQLRRRGIAAHALDAVQEVMGRAAGAEGLSLSAHWCWQRAVRFYLGLGWWVANWKHALVLVRSDTLCPYRVEVAGTAARFSARINQNWTPLIEADHRGTSLGWTELAAFSPLADSHPALCHRVPGTFAVHLAVRGWPLVRSAALWERRYHWSDLGMPEGLAYKIAVFESVAREHGYEIRTPRIPGLDYEADRE